MSNSNRKQTIINTGDAIIRISKYFYGNGARVEIMTPSDTRDGVYVPPESTVFFLQQSDIDSFLLQFSNAFKDN